MSAAAVIFITAKPGARAPERRKTKKDDESRRPGGARVKLVERRVDVIVPLLVDVEAVFVDAKPGARAPERQKTSKNTNSTKGPLL